VKAAMTILVVTSLLSGPIWAQAPEPDGAEFQVNTYTTSRQVSADVAVDAQGNFVVVWESPESYGTNRNESSIQAQRYDSSGTPIGSQFQVNSYTIGDQHRPKLAADNQGNIVVVWDGTSYGTDTDRSVQGQRYDSSGAPLGGQFQVNSYTTDGQWAPAVAVDAQGNFVVVWQHNEYYFYTSIHGQLFDASGTLLGSQFQVSSYTTEYDENPSVASDAEGNFIVVWDSWDFYGTDTSSRGIQGQLFDASGTPLGAQFQVNSYTTDIQWAPAVAADTEGNFVVVWGGVGSYGTDTSSTSIHGQLFDASGTPFGSEFQVNSYTPSAQAFVAVATHPEGDFVVVWESWGSYGTDTGISPSIQGQLFDASGTPLGSQFQVNSYTTDRQEGPAVAADAEGKLVVVWESLGSYGTDTSMRSIQGQRYIGPIFTDGFESGDTSAWSSTVP